MGREKTPRHELSRLKDYAKDCKMVLGNCFGPFLSSREEKMCQIAEVVLRFHIIILQIRVVHPLG